MDIIDMTMLQGDGPGKPKYLTDGYFTLATSQHRLSASSAVGLNHFGFTVDDCPDTMKRLVVAEVEEPKSRPADRPFAKYRGVDLEGNWFDISRHSFAKPETAIDRRRRLNRNKGAFS